MSEYAPEYTKRERIFLLIKQLSWALPVFGAVKFWFLPKFITYAGHAECYNYGAFTGLHVVFYGLFVGLPLLLVFGILPFEGRRAIKVLRVGQSPLPGEKVLRKTKYTYGLRAKVKPFILLLILFFLVGFSIKGVFSANEIINKAQNKSHPACENS